MSPGDGWRMNISPVTKIAAVAAALLWATKAVVIGIAGGLGESPLESPLFGLGLLAFVVGVVSLVGPSGPLVIATGGRTVSTVKERGWIVTFPAASRARTRSV